MAFAFVAHHAVLGPVGLRVPVQSLIFLGSQLLFDGFPILVEHLIGADAFENRCYGRIAQKFLQEGQLLVPAFLTFHGFHRHYADIIVMGQPQFFLQAFQTGLVQNGIDQMVHAASDSCARRFFYVTVAGQSAESDLARLFQSLKGFLDRRISGGIGAMPVKHEEIHMIGV